MESDQANSMEEAIQQLSTNTLECMKRKATGPSGLIIVTMDTRALAPDHRIYYRNLHKFRVTQMNAGVDLTDLSDEQWGMVQLDKCHHISTTSTSKDGPQSFRVRICKTCCQEDSHIELGTYVDQESAILVNDTFEILNERLDRLIVLRVEDRADLHHLVAKKYDRSKGRDYACIMELISERVSAIEGKKRRPSVSEIIPAFAKRSGELSAGGSTGDLNSSAQYSSCSTSSEASDEQRTTSRLSGSHKSLSAVTSHASLHGSGVKPPLSASKRTPSSARKLSISSVHDADLASNSGSSSTIDDDITVTEETSTALRELSTICYQRLLSPSINPKLQEERLSPGTMLTGTSLFGRSDSTADLVRSLEAVRNGGSALSSVTNSTSKNTAVGDRLHLSSPFSSNSNATALMQDGGSPPSATEARSGAGNSGSLNKRPREVAVADDTAALASLAGANAASGAHNGYDRLASIEGLTPRKRAATFSVSEPYPYHYNYNAESNNPIATLTWLASMEECEVDVARSLFELRGNTEAATSLFDARTNALSMALGLGSSGNYGSYMATGRDVEMEEDDYYDQDGDEGGNGDDGEDDGEEEDGAYYNQMQQLHQHMVGGSGKPGSKPIYGFPSTYPHNGKMLNGAAGGAAGAQRARSSSLSMIDRSEAAWAILGNTGGYRSRMDPLSMALKKYHERGGSANAAASGFVGIYSPEDRKQRIMRFLEKRKRRMWTKKVKYDVRKNFADSRVRVKGRFVKKQEEETFLAESLNTSYVSHTSAGSCDRRDSMDAGDELAYDHTDVDLELLDQLNAHSQQHQVGRLSPKSVPTEDGLNLKLKLTGRGSGASSNGAAGRRRSDSAAKAEGKAEGKGAELKLTISGSSRRRRNSRVEEAVEGTAEAAGTAEAYGASHTSPSSAVAMRLERANLNSAVKPAPAEA